MVKGRGLQNRSPSDDLFLTNGQRLEDGRLEAPGSRVPAVSGRI